MAKTTKEPFDAKPLVREFVDPLASVEAREVDSEKQAANEIIDLQERLKSHTDWKVRVYVMTRAMELLKGGIQYYQKGNLEAIMPHIVTCAGDLRPLVVKPTSLLIAALAQSLTYDFENGAEALFPTLLRQVVSTNPHIANCAHLALLKIIRHCHTRKIGKMYLDNYTSQVPANRHIAVEAAHIILETWKPKISQPLLPEVDKIVIVLQRDPYASIRNIATAASKVIRCEDSFKRPRSTLFYVPAPSKNAKPEPIMLSPPSSPKTPMKSGKREKTPQQTPKQQSVVEPEATEESFWTDVPITAVMPPSNKDDASVFKSVLDKLVAEDKVDTIRDAIQTLAPSIIKAAALLPGKDVWEEDMWCIYQSYAKDLRNQIMKMMNAFNFEEWFMRIMEEVYPLQQWSETLNISTPRHQELAARYFTSVFTMDPPPVYVTDRIRSVIETLIPKVKDTVDTRVLSSVLESTSKPSSIDGAIRLLISALNDELPWQHPLDDVAALFKATQDEIMTAEQIFDSQLPSLLTNGSDEQKLAILDMITAAMAKLKKVSFASCADIVLSLIRDPNCPFQSEAHECFASMLNDVKTLAIAIQRLEQKQGYEALILSAMLRYFQTAPPPRMVPTRKIVVRKVSPFMTSDDVTIRKYAVLILAEFKKRIPKEFHSLFKKLTPAQQRMIKIHAGA